MSTLIIGNVDVSEFLSPSDLQIDYANKYGEGITTADGKDVAKIIGQEVTVSAKLNLVSDDILANVKAAVIGKQKIKLSADEIPNGEYKVTSFKHTLAYQTGVKYWDINITLSCYLSSDGL